MIRCDHVVKPTQKLNILTLKYSIFEEIEIVIKLCLTALFVSALLESYKFAISVLYYNIFSKSEIDCTLEPVNVDT